MIRITSFLVIIFLISANLAAQTALLQVIHNSADPSLALIDVWRNDELIADSLPFHHATPYLTLPSTDSAHFEVRLHGDTTAGPPLLEYTTSIVTGSKHIFIVNGVLDSISYQPYRALRIDHKYDALDFSAGGTSLDITFCHGTTDADSVDITETALFQLTAFESVAFGQFTDYLNIFTADYSFGMNSTSTGELLGDFSAPFGSLNWAGLAITVVSGGFLNQSLNDNGIPFGLWATTRNGGPLVPLVPNTLGLNASVQWINNSSYAQAASVGIHVNGIPWENALEVHHATEFRHFPAGQQVSLSMRSNLTQSPNDTLWSDTLHLISGRRYRMVMFGAGTTDSPLQLSITDQFAQPYPTADSITLQFFHGTSCIPEFTALVDTAEQNLWFNIASEGVYSPLLTLAAENEECIINSGSDSISTFILPLGNETWLNQIPLVFSFNSSQCDSLQLFILPDGGGAMHPLQQLFIPAPPVFAQLQFVNLAADQLTETVDVYVNDSLVANNLDFRSATGVLTVEITVPTDIVVTDAGATDTTQALLHQPLTFEPNGRYRLILAGILSDAGYNPAPALRWLNVPPDELPASVANTTELRLIHAATDAGFMATQENTTPIVPMFNNLNFGEYSYLQALNSDSDYGISLFNADVNFLYGTYALPVQSWNWSDSSIALVASGFRQPLNNSGGTSFTLHALTSSGQMIELPQFVSVGEQSNHADVILYPNPADRSVQLRLMVGKPGRYQLEVFNALGNLVEERQISLSANSHMTMPCENLADGKYIIKLTGVDVCMTRRLTVRH